MVKKQIKKIGIFLWKNKLFILIISLGLFLRLHNLSNSIGFAWDQERDAFTIKQIIVDKKLTLIGPRVVNDNGFMLGPYFFYLLLPFYLITKLNPYAMILFVATYNFVFLSSSFFILKKIFSQKIAYVFIFIWSILPLAISIDTISWNPLLVPFLFIFLFYLLNTLNFSKIKTWLILGFYLGFSFHIHVQLIILSFTAFVFLLIKFSKKDFLKKIIFLFAGFIFSFLPLLIFDLRHDFLNLNLFLNFFENSTVAKNYLAFIPVLTNYFSSIFLIKSQFLSILFWLLLSLILFFLSKKSHINKTLFFTWLFFPIIFIFYGKRPSEYYFNFCLPIIILVFSQLIAKLKINYKIIFLFFVTIYLSSIYFKIKDNNIGSFSLTNKVNVVKHISKITSDKKFNLSYSVPAGQNNGFSYLLDFYQVKPSGDFKDPLIQIIIPSKTGYKSFGDISIDFPFPFNQ